MPLRLSARLAVVLVLAAALAACGGGMGGDDGALSVAAPDGPSTRTSREALPIDASARPDAPPIEGETLTGERVALADLRGRPVFVKVFAGY